MYLGQGALPISCSTSNERKYPLQPKFALSSVILALAVANGVALAETPKFTDGTLVDAKGMTLYVFDKDDKDKSNCKGACATAWPPAVVEAEVEAGSEFTIVTREDGARQWAYKGSPLYRFAGDAKAGDAAGDNKGGVWHVVGSRGAAQAGPGASMGYSRSY